MQNKTLESTNPKARLLKKKHEQQISKGRLLFEKAGGLSGKRWRAFVQKPATFSFRARKAIQKHTWQLCRTHLYNIYNRYLRINS